MITGSTFAALYGPKGLAAWEGAALGLAKEGGLVDWPLVPLALTDGTHHVTLHVRSDVLAVGTPDDLLRLPPTPSAAQDILNLTGELLPTPWIAYQIWRAAPFKIAPIPITKLGEQNRGASMLQYGLHSKAIDAALAAAGAPMGALVAGLKKHVVVSNIVQKGKVVIFGWYRPPPAPDVYDDRKPMEAGDRQPIQPKSNLHGAFYVDYAHGIQAVSGMCNVDGIAMPTADLYRHPTLSRLVSNEGPVLLPRYPSTVPVAAPAVRPAVTSTPAPNAAIDELSRGPWLVPTEPSVADLGLAEIARGVRRK